LMEQGKPPYQINVRGLRPDAVVPQANLVPNPVQE